MDNVTSAKLLLSCLDLTSLHDNDTKEGIKEFCSLACTPYGNPAAICVYPRFVNTVKENLRKMPVATVINFPQGENDTDILKREIPSSLSSGADELDIVLPYKDLLKGRDDEVRQYLTCARKLCGKKVMKVIIESGELKSVNMIKKATELCIEAKADFVKTSTGKTEISATPEAANIILETIRGSGKNVGFKASGGIKTFMDAKQYLVLAQSIMDKGWVDANHFRIGASSLRDDLLQTIEQGY